MKNAFTAPPGLIVVMYNASWGSDGYADDKAAIKIDLEKYPVVGFVWEDAKGEDDESQTTPLYLDMGGSVSELGRTPYDWGEEGVGLGVFLADTPDEVLVEIAKKRCRFRQGLLKRMSEREAA
jgi:hypothetical protein